MRLDKFLSETAMATRSEAKKAIRGGAVAVSGAVVRQCDAAVDPEQDVIFFRGERVIYRRYIYVILNKPDGYVSATEDGREKTVLDLLPEEMSKKGVFPCGRLDKNTLGLMLLTDNGELAHRILSPKNHVEKKYRFKSKFPLDPEDVKRFEGGLTLEDGYVTLPDEYYEGLGEIGVSALRRFVEGGGRVLAWTESVVYLSEKLGLGLRDYLKEFSVV